MFCHIFTLEQNKNTSDILWEYTNNYDTITLSDDLTNYEKLEIYINTSNAAYGIPATLTYDTSLLTQNSILDIYCGTIGSANGWGFITQYTITNSKTIQYKESKNFYYNGNNTSRYLFPYKIVGINKKS